MAQLTKSNIKPGQMLVKREVKKTGRDAAVLDELGDVKTGEETIILGPFTQEEVHATASSDMKVTLSENYHSITVGVHVSIPVPATEAGLKAGLDYAFDKCTDFLNKEMPGARKALRSLAGR